MSANNKIILGGLAAVALGVGLVLLVKKPEKPAASAGALQQLTYHGDLQDGATGTGNGCSSRGGSQTKSPWLHATGGRDPNVRKFIELFLSKISQQSTCKELMDAWCSAKSQVHLRDLTINKIEAALVGSEAGAGCSFEDDFCRNIHQFIQWWHEEGRSDHIKCGKAGQGSLAAPS